MDLFYPPKNGHVNKTQYFWESSQTNIYKSENDNGINDIMKMLKKLDEDGLDMWKISDSFGSRSTTKSNEAEPTSSVLCKIRRTRSFRVL